MRSSNAPIRLAKNFALIAISANLLMTASCSSSKKDQSSVGTGISNWQAQPLTVDGSDADWDTRLPYSDKVEKFNFGVSNDAENIYIRIATGDQHTQQKIIQGGMTVWINNQAQKDFDKAVGIGFPLETRPTREQELMRQAQPDKYQAPRQIKLEDCTQYGLYNFGGEEAIANYDYGQPNKTGINIKMGYNSANSLIYEASIPLSAVYPRGNSTGKTYAVGIYLEGIPGAHDDRPRGGGGGVSVGGGLGFGSFGSGGGLSIGIGSGSLGRIGGNKGALNKQGKIWQLVDVARGSSK